MINSITIILKCVEFPGLEFEGKQAVHVGVQRKKEVVDAVAGDSTEARFVLPIQVKSDKAGRPDFGGSYIHGKSGDRFLYLVWFDAVETQPGFRRAKIKLNHLTWADLEQNTLQATVTMTDPQGSPVCATLKPDLIRWEL